MFSRSPLILVLTALFAAMLAMFVATPARAVGATAGQPLQVCIARATPGMTALQVLRRPTGFDCTSRQTDFGPGDFWVVTREVPASVQGWVPLGVRTESLWQRSVTLYALFPDGRVATRRMPDAGAGAFAQLGAIMQQKLPYDDHAPIRLAWRIEGSANLRGIVVSPTIATPVQIATANVTMAAIYAAFTGLAAALLVHNIVMWRALRQRFQLWYVATLTVILCYTFTASGALAWALPELSNTARMRINYALLGLSGVAVLRFARAFFEARVFSRPLAYYANFATIFLLVSSLAFALLAPWQIGLLERAFNIGFVAVVAVAVPMFWRAYRLRSPNLGPALLALGGPLTLASIRLAHNFGLIGWNFWVDNATFLSGVTTTLGASLAIAWRVRQIAQERDAARASALAATLLAETDSLTGLNNRRAFLTRAIGRAGPQTLLLLDLDRFKQVNETIGHDGGDEVLRRVARALREACPPHGLAVRLGGEEFALLCDAAEAPSPDAVLSRLRETRMPYDLTVTASIGGCTGALVSERDWKLLYRAADRALFAAKKAGRDRARTAEPHAQSAA